MLAVLLSTFPFFALVLGGYVATRRGALPQVAIPGLNTFVLYFALPCLLFRFGATTPITRHLDVSMVGVYMTCAVIVVAVIVAMTRRGHIGWNDAAFGALVGVFPNTGYMGVPLLVALFGTQAAGPAIATILIDLLLTSSLCIALSRLGGADGQGVGPAFRSTVKAVAVNPMPWAIVLGVVTYASGVTLPAPIMQTIGLLADAASPVALFAIGAVLARSQSSAAARTPLRDYVPVALIKLLLHPLLMLAIGYGAIRLGAPLDPFALKVIVLVAALPSASNVVMLAERFGADSGRLARIILVSTSLAFLTFSAAVTLLAGH